MKKLIKFVNLAFKVGHAMFKKQKIISIQSRKLQAKIARLLCEKNKDLKTTFLITV